MGVREESASPNLLSCQAMNINSLCSDTRFQEHSCNFGSVRQQHRTVLSIRGLAGWEGSDAYEEEDVLFPSVFHFGLGSPRPQ